MVLRQRQLMQCSRVTYPWSGARALGLLLKRLRANAVCLFEPMASSISILSAEFTALFLHTHSFSDTNNQHTHDRLPPCGPSIMDANLA